MKLQIFMMKKLKFLNFKMREGCQICTALEWTEKYLQILIPELINEKGVIRGFLTIKKNQFSLGSKRIGELFVAIYFFYSLDFIIFLYI